MKRWAPTAAVVFFFILAGGVGLGWAEAEITLWRQGEHSISSSLPASWHAMSKEAMVAAFAARNESSPQNSGALIAGFRQQYEENEAGFPYIVVFKSEGGQITPDEMQKTFAWFQKNSELAQGILPTNVRQVTIEDIAYLQDRAAISFQTRIEMEDRMYRSVGSIFFLRNGYLSVGCYAPADLFPNNIKIFYDFIDEMNITAGLRYPPGRALFSPARHSLPAEWLLQYWQQLLGVGILCGIYSLIFLRGKKKYGRRAADKAPPPEDPSKSEALP